MTATDIPESVYRDAAVAALRSRGGDPGHVALLSVDVLDWYIDHVWLTTEVRAVVKSAYRAGILAAQRAVLVALEQDRQAWGPTKAANGVYDMCRQVVRRVTDEMAGEPRCP